MALDPPFNASPHLDMSEGRISFLVALAVSLGFHAGLLALWMAEVPPDPQHLPTVSEPLHVSLKIAPIQEMNPAANDDRAKSARLEHLVPKPLDPSTKPRSKPAILALPITVENKSVPIADSNPPPPTPEKNLASMPAPPPPSAEEWEQASTYTLKNSKRYRYNWGQLVRSKMGTAVEGPQQGLVRFHIEIAPDGKLARVEVLWATSEVAEKLALQAIRSMPPLPPTPTGEPLVFEKTIAFMPFETGWPPSYKLDCLPDVLTFSNRFAWDGSSKTNPESTSPSHRPPPPAECITDSTADSIEQEEAEMKRQVDQWRWGR